MPAWLSPPHTHLALSMLSPERSVLRKAPRHVLSSTNNFCNTRCTLGHFLLPISHSWICDSLLLSGTCLFPTCLEQVEEVPASCQLGKADCLYFALKLSTFQGWFLSKHPRICGTSLCSPSVLLRTSNIYPLSHCLFRLKSRNFSRVPSRRREASEHLRCGCSD